MQRMDQGLNAEQTLHLQDGTYRISNAYQAGAMFTSSRRFSEADHEIGLSSEDKELCNGNLLESAGKWRWEVERQPDGSYKISSKQVGGALFVSMLQLNAVGDCKVGLSPEDKESEEVNTGKWRWFIEVQDNGTYKISNKERGGALFCSACQFGGQTDDFQVGWSPADKEEANGNTGKWRWHFHFAPPQLITCSMRVSSEGLALVTCFRGLSGQELVTLEVKQGSTIASLLYLLSVRLMVPFSEITLLDQQGNLLPHTSSVAVFLSGDE